MDLSKEVARLRRQADVFANAGNWGPEAEAVNRRLMELVPKQAIAYTRAARCAIDRGDNQAARDLYQAVLKVDPHNVIAENHLRGPVPATSLALTKPRHIVQADTIQQPTSRSASSAELRALHDRLDVHFSRLRQQRNELAPGSPVFAFEHGLESVEIVLVADQVRDSVKRRKLPHDAWLPFIVYATELGYEFSGDEYWLTFEDRTPGWISGGQSYRYYIRDKFELFRDRYDGAIPRGAWAAHRSIIGWPITHAILPTDLQRQLAQLLFDYRRVYTSDLLAHPSEFGKRLAGQAWQTSPRFQIFAENTELLGHVSAALLLASDEECAYLLRSTLHRIIEDLESEREAKAWLQRARRRAGEVRAKGLHAVVRREGESAAQTGERLPVSTDPLLTVRECDSNWTVYLEIPDLSVLAERLPSLVQELATSRAIVAGVDGAPLARKQLLYPGKEVKLARWPPDREPLIQLESGTTAANSLLRDQCVISSGPVWVFRIRERGAGTEVRGKFVRPSHEYLLLSRDRLPRAQEWIRPVGCGTSGVYAYRLSVPQSLDSAAIDSLKQIRVASVSEVVVRPAGLVPAMWDGEGEAEWLVGEDPLIAVGTSRDVAHGIFSLDNEPLTVDWPAGELEIFLELEDLAVGSHELRCSLFPSDASQPVADGVLDVIIRAPVTRPSSGSYREGLMITADPLSPTLEELWSGRTQIEILGPDGVEVTIEVALMDRMRRKLGSHQTVIALPVQSSDWDEIVMSYTRAAPSIQRGYDASEIVLIRARHPLLGSAELDCERSFFPLRWASGSDHGGPFARLVNNTESQDVVIQGYRFDRPERAEQVECDELMRFRFEVGGMLRATTPTGATASVILPPSGRDLERLHRVELKAEFPDVARTSEQVRRLLSITRMWADASLPADALSGWRRAQTLKALTSQLAVLVCGPGVDWGSGAKLGSGRRQLYNDLSGHLATLRTFDIENRVRFFAGALNIDRVRLGGYVIPFKQSRTETPEMRLAEFVLRLASAPQTLLMWPDDELASGIDLVLHHPVLLCAARFLVLETARREKQDGEAVYEGWAWP